MMNRQSKTSRYIGALPLLAALAMVAGGTRSACAAGLAGPQLTLQVAPTAQASHALYAASLAAGRSYVADLEIGSGDTVLRGTTAKPLPAGRYRAHVPVALSPLGDVKTSALQVTVSAGEAKRSEGTLYFTKADEFVDIPVDFTADGHGFVPYSVAWAQTGPSAKKNARRDIDLSALDPEGDESAALGSGGAALVPDAEGMVANKTLAGIKYHLAVGTPSFEVISPVALSDVLTDKIVYAPGQAGTVAATLKNWSAATCNVTLKASLISGIDDITPVSGQTLTLAPGQEKTLSIPFETGKLRWGAELHLSAAAAGSPPDEAGSVFAVSDNFWSTSIFSGINFSRPYADLKTARAKAEGWRKDGFTAFESGFWAPDEFGDFTPQTEHFLSGQNEYRGSVSGTKNIISEAHKRGISAAVYSNLWGGDGLRGYDMVREHPDWMGASGFNTALLEMWPVLQADLSNDSDFWMVTGVNNENSDAPLNHHADEFIASHKQFGWDGTRYDSYGSSPWVIKATDQVRKRVEATLPNYRWGYNSFVLDDEKHHALDIMLHGGQLSMEESIRSIAKEKGSFANYLNVLTTYRDVVWRHGGHLGVCYDTPVIEGESVPLDEMYLCSFILATGTHPFYSTMETRYGDYPRFALRYSGLLWDNTMRPLKEPEKTIHFKGPNFCQWQKLARVSNLGGNRHRIIVHLLNPPVDDVSLNNFGAKAPPVVRAMALDLALPADAKIDSAYCLNALQDSEPIKLSTKKDGALTALTVPEVRIWEMVVVDYTSAEAL